MRERPGFAQALLKGRAKFSPFQQGRVGLVALCPSLWSSGVSLKHDFPHQRGLP